MRNEEITERLTTSTPAQLQEELDYANWVLRQPRPFGPRPDRRAEWVEYRDQVLAEIAARG